MALADLVIPMIASTGLEKSFVLLPCEYFTSKRSPMDRHEFVSWLKGQRRIYFSKCYINNISYFWIFIFNTSESYYKYVEELETDWYQPCMSEESSDDDVELTLESKDHHTIDTDWDSQHWNTQPNRWAPTHNSAEETLVDPFVNSQINKGVGKI
jgi:hypothetical protein